MQLNTFPDGRAFLSAVGSSLEKNEVANGLILSIIAQISDKPPVWMRGDPYLAAVYDQHGLSAAGMITPPYGLVLAQGDCDPQPGITAIAEDLTQRKWPLLDVNGPKQCAKQFAETWTSLNGSSYKLLMAERIYRLTHVTAPQGVQGKARWAAETDQPLLVKWMGDFNLEALGELVLDEEMNKLAQVMLQEERVLLWQVDERVVSMAICVRETPHGAVVAYVYTPPKHRRHGYAAALVAELSQRCLDSGKDFCMLFTDLANPTSNSIYQQIGYQPVCDFDKYGFRE